MKRTLYFANPCKLCLKNSQLIVQKDEVPGTTSVPIEDIGIMIIENQQVSISIPLISALSQNNVSVVFCNERHMPQAILQNLENNGREGQYLRLQIDASEPTRKNAWKQIVETKIRNQSMLLTKLHKEGKILKPYYTSVKSGDSDNREGAAARVYWKALFGDEFIRDRNEVGINGLLNYGYTILRAATARALMGSGLMPSLGLYHHNRGNAFPLADDMMEPYRPFVDEVVYELCEEGLLDFSVETKSRLVNVLNCDTIVNNNMKPLSLALTMSTASLAKYLNKEITTLSFPSLSSSFYEYVKT